MNHGDFQGRMIKRPRRKRWTKYSDGFIFLHLVVAPVFITLFFILPNSWQQPISILFGILYLVLLLIVLFLPRIRFQTAGTFSLSTDGKIYLCETIDEADAVAFHVNEITHMQLTPPYLDCIYGKMHSCHCELLVDGRHYRFDFTVDGYQQRENLVALVKQWHEEGYDVEMIA